MNNPNPTLEVYRSLRAEIIEISSRQFNLFTFSITSTSVILGIAVQNRQGLIALVPLIILFFTGILMFRHADTTLINSSFIAHFIEEKEGWAVTWETLQNQYRKHRKGGKLWATWLTYEVLLSVIGFACIGLSVVFADPGPDQIGPAVVGLILAIFWGIFSLLLWIEMRKAGSGQKFDECKARWKEIEAQGPDEKSS